MTKPPEEPKARANKAFALLIERRWRDVLDFGLDSLTEDPANELLAAYVVQAAGHDPGTDEPETLLPPDLLTTASVYVARIFFYRRRGRPEDAQRIANEALAAHPGEEQIRRLAAEATIDEAISGEEFLRTRLVPERDRPAHPRRDRCRLNS